MNWTFSSLKENGTKGRHNKSLKVYDKSIQKKKKKGIICFLQWWWEGKEVNELQLQQEISIFVTIRSVATNILKLLY